MGLITKTKDWVDNEVVTYTDINGNFDTVYNVINGNLDTNNVDTTAIATVSTSQTLTNKTITAPIISGSAGAAPTTAGQVQYDSTANILKYGNGTSTISIGGSSWVPYTTVIPSSGTLDDPTFELTFAAVDLTSTLYAGMKVKLTQSTTKYFIITKVAFSTDTTVTLYGGTDYDLVSTGTTAVSAFSYSEAKAPAGFPMDPNVWTVETSITSNQTQTSPASATFYNVGTTTIDVPVGVWNLEYSISAYVQYGTTVNGLLYIALSTSNSSVSDTQLRASQYQYQTTSITGESFYRRKFVSLTTKATYYLILSQQGQSPATSITIDGGSGGCTIRAICAYL